MKRTTIFFGCLTIAILMTCAVTAPLGPDALERVADSVGFANLALEGESWSPLADYETKFFEAGWLAQLSAGLLGVMLVFLVGLIFGQSLLRKQEDK